MFDARNSWVFEMIAPEGKVAKSLAAVLPMGSIQLAGGDEGGISGGDGGRGEGEGMEGRDGYAVC